MKWSHTLAPSSKTDGIKMSFMIHFYPSGGTNNKHTWFNGHWYEIFKASFTKLVTYTYRTSIVRDLEIHWRRRPSEHLKWPDWTRVLCGILQLKIFFVQQRIYEMSQITRLFCYQNLTRIISLSKKFMVVTISGGRSDTFYKAQ